MAMNPNKDSNNNDNNRNRQLIPGGSSRAAHPPPPIAEWQSLFQDPVFRVYFEDTIRTIINKEFRTLMSHYNLPPRLLQDPNIQARYQLQFINKVKDPTFTTNPVRDEIGQPIRVQIYDLYTKSIVSVDYFLSSTKVRITVLDAEFWKNRVNWSRSEFNQSVLKEREGKGAILIGRSLTILLENGVGTFENIFFNDNSSWTKSGFRLGVTVEVEGEEGYYLNGERVQEGVSDHFQVRDRRGQASQKPDRLKLTHKVQSLKKVGKDRASQLQKNNINTVEDFLKFYYNDEHALREILAIKSETDKGWMSMIEHAKQCAGEYQDKYNALNNSSQPQQALVHQIGRNMSLWTNDGSRVVGSGSSESNLFANDIIDGADYMAIFDQLPAVCDPSSMNVFNEHISTAAVEHIGETQLPLFLETNDANVIERGNILNGNSVQYTNVGDAESSPNYNKKVLSGGGGGGGGGGRGPPLPPHKCRPRNPRNIFIFGVRYCNRSFRGPGSDW